MTAMMPPAHLPYPDVVPINALHAHPCLATLLCVYARNLRITLWLSDTVMPEFQQLCMLCFVIWQPAHTHLYSHVCKVCGLCCTGWYLQRFLLYIDYVFTCKYDELGCKQDEESEEGEKEGEGDVSDVEDEVDGEGDEGQVILEEVDFAMP
jgi:hypothetical protein